MNIVYNISLDDTYVTVTTAKCQLPLFGCWCEMDITVYCMRASEWARSETAITFGVRQLKDTVRGDVFDAVPNGVLKMSRGEGTDRQVFEQHITIPNIIGQLLDKSQLDYGGVPAGRTITGSVLRRVESIFETIRSSIRKSFSGEIMSEVLQKLDDRYGQITSNVIEKFLGEIHWRLLLAKAGCDEDCLNVIEYASTHNPPQFYDILHDGEVDIPQIALAPIHRFDQTTVANLKATALLRSICGDKLADEFDKFGKFVIFQDGYQFILEPGQFVACTDPNGKTAKLCIHTANFSCNPIDEIIIAYLHVKHKLKEYMRVAIAHGAEQGFQRELIGV